MTTLRSSMRAHWRPIVAAYGLALAAGLILFALRGIDANWDLRNYHIAGPWLQLSGHAWDHVLPSYFQTYFPTLVYYPSYVALTTIGPYAWRVIQVAWQAIFWVAMLGTFWMVLRRERVAWATRRPAMTFALLVLLAGAGGMSLSVLGTSFVDLSLAVLIAAAIARALWVGFVPSVRRGVEIGVLLGITVGLKSTSLVTAAAFAIAFYAVLALRTRAWGAIAREVAAFLAVSAVAVLALYGYWMVEVYGATGNPVFPYANGIFRSPLAPAGNWADTRFIPGSLKGWIGRPIRLAVSQSYLISEEPFRDIRYALFLYGLLPFAALWLGVRARLATVLRENPYTACLTLFNVIGLLLWAALFSIGRYMPVFELLTGFLLLRAILAFDRPWAPVLAVLLAAAHLATMTIPSWGHRTATSDGSPRFAPARPAFGRALVVLDGQPMGYTLPYLGREARTVMRGDLTAAGSFFASRVRGLLARTWPGGIWYLSEGTAGAGADAYLAGYGLARTTDCRPVRTWYTELRACRLTATARR